MSWICRTLPIWKASWRNCARMDMGGIRDLALRQADLEDVFLKVMHGGHASQ
jgi:hypothetical protein